MALFEALKPFVLSVLGGYPMWQNLMVLLPNEFLTGKH